MIKTHAELPVLTAEQIGAIKTECEKHLPKGVIALTVIVGRVEGGLHLEAAVNVDKPLGVKTLRDAASLFDSCQCESCRARNSLPSPQ